MEDPILNRNLDETKELQTRWSQFHDFCLMAMKGQAITAQAEMKFLELKSRIAMLHDSFMSGLKHSQKTGQNIMQILSDSILLRRVSHYSEAERQKFEFDWNEAYILINEQISTLEDEQKRLAAISERAFKAGKRNERISAIMHNFLHGMALRTGVTLGIILLVFWIVPDYIWSYRGFDKMGPLAKPYVFVANYFYRPFIDKDYAYDNFSDVPRLATYKPVPQIQRTDPASLTINYFKSSVLAKLLGNTQTRKDADALVDTNTSFSSESFAAEGQTANFFFIMFAKTDEAKKFIDLLKSGVAARSAADKTTIRNEYYVLRRANLILIGVSQHVHRSGYIQEDFMIKNDPPSELNQ